MATKSSLPDAVEPRAPMNSNKLQAFDSYRRENSPMRAALLQRLGREVDALAERLDEGNLERALGAPTDLAALVIALEHAPHRAPPVDPILAAAKARGRAAREELLRAEGGVVGLDEFRSLRGNISRQAVDKARIEGRLVAVREAVEWLFPQWQLKDGDFLPGLKEVLQLLNRAGVDGWAQMIFFLNTDTAREGETPLQALQAGRAEAAIAAARVYGTHGAI